MINFHCWANNKSYTMHVKQCLLIPFLHTLIQTFIWNQIANLHNRVNISIFLDSHPPPTLHSNNNRIHEIMYDYAPTCKRQLALTDQLGHDQHAESQGSHLFYTYSMSCTTGNTKSRSLSVSYGFIDVKYCKIPN
jgi:hypothetical protein